MKKPEEIKKGLECCFTRGKGCDYCPYVDKDGVICTNGELGKDALTFIKQLEVNLKSVCKTVKQLEAELEEEKTHHQHTLECAQQFEEDWEQMKQERDALLKYFTDSHWAACDICKHEPESHDINDCMHIRQVGLPCFEWRGLCKENGGIEA